MIYFFFNLAVIIALTSFFLWGLWRLLPFCESLDEDKDKPYFHQRVRLRTDGEPSDFAPRRNVLYLAWPIILVAGLLYLLDRYVF